MSDLAYIAIALWIVVLLVLFGPDLWVRIYDWRVERNRKRRAERDEHEQGGIG